MTIRYTLPFAAILISSICLAQPDFNLKDRKIDSLMESHLVNSGKHPVFNFLLYARNEQTGYVVQKGKGTIGRNSNIIDADYQYNVASITKTLVATLILQLEEEGKLNTSDRASKYLNNIGFLRFSQFHRMNKIPCSDSITINMLLNHTSGIADIFTDATTRFNISVLLHKKRQFNTERIIERYFRYNLNNKPLNKPGKGYHYSDINYMLLGFIIENVTGKSLPEEIRARILTPLQMGNTYFDYYEPQHGNGKRIDAFLNGINMTKKINTSYEWGGGGIVSTTHDMAIFIEALFSDKLFSKHSTLDKMLDFSAAQKFGANYGMGIIKYDLNGRTFYGHGGFYGSILAYDPKDKITFSANIGQANPTYDTGKLVNDLLEIIASR